MFLRLLQIILGQCAAAASQGVSAAASKAVGGDDLGKHQLQRWLAALPASQ